jgi:hypothetical protein
MQRGEKLVDLIIAQRTRDALNGFHADCAPHGSLSRRSPHEGTVTIKDTCVGRIIHFIVLRADPIPILGKSISLFDLVEFTMVQMHLQLPSP